MNALMTVASLRDKNQVSKHKKKAKLCLRYLIPVSKWINPLKFIYYMDMVFPQDIQNATEEDYYAGRLAFLKNVQTRPTVVYDKKNQYIIIIYESPSIHILQNQCEYFQQYQLSQGNEKLKNIAYILDSWRSLWTEKNLNIMQKDLMVTTDTIEHNHVPNSVTEVEEIHDNRVASRIRYNNSPTVNYLRKIYYFERICKYRGNQIIGNTFVVGYSTGLQERLGQTPECFLSDTLRYKIPIIIRPTDTLKYRTNLCSHLMFSNYPRLNCDIEFFAKDKGQVVNPYTTVNRTYSTKDSSLVVRCTFSTMSDNDIHTLNRKTPVLKQPDDSHDKFLIKSIKGLIPGIRKKINKMKKRIPTLTMESRPRKPLTDIRRCN